MRTKSGRPLHPIGVGTWGIASRTNASRTGTYGHVEAVHGNEAAEIEAIRYSISRGQNHLDCAELYGAFYTDEVVGRAIADLKRDDLYIADKLWRSSVGSGLVRPTVEKMLQKLAIDYLDLLYIHWPWEDVDWQTAIPQIDELINEGLVRAFGVSNFTVADMEKAQSLAAHPITANQMNYNVLYKNEVSQTFLNYCQQHDIQLIAYQPVKRQAVLHDETVREIAQAHSATAAQVALAWLLRKGALPIPKALQKSHIDENLKATELQLTAADTARLDKLAT